MKMKTGNILTRRMVLAGAGAAGLLSLIAGKAACSLPLTPETARPEPDMTGKRKLMFAMTCCLYRRDPRAQAKYRYYQEKLAELYRKHRKTAWPQPERFL